MKKLSALILVFCLILLSGCKEKELINVSVFIRRFNKISDSKIDKKNLRAVEDGDTLVYSFLLDGNILLTLKSQKDTGKIKQCSVTEQNTENLNENLFFEKCCSVIAAYEKNDVNHAKRILHSFSFNDNELSAKDGFYRIDFLMNEAAVFLQIESSRLNDEKPTDQKLYEQTYS